MAVKNGEIKKYHTNSMLCSRKQYVNDISHGEFIVYNSLGNVILHGVYINDIHTQIKPNSLTNEEKMYLSMTHGIKWLSWDARFS